MQLTVMVRGRFINEYIRGGRSLSVNDSGVTKVKEKVANETQRKQKKGKNKNKKLLWKKLYSRMTNKAKNWFFC